MANTPTRKLRLGALTGATGLIILLAGLGGSPLEAKQPSNVSQLLGTWVNTNADGELAQVVITDVNGNLEVHPYGSCSPTLCDWGINPALRFSSSVDSATAIGFQATVDFTFKTAYMQGHLITGPAGQSLLEITTQSKFATGDPRQDYELTEDFQLSSTATPGSLSTLASPSLTTQPEEQATDVSELIGTWLSTKVDGGLVQVVISNVNGNLEVHPYGSCSPTPCDWGINPASRFSTSVDSATAIGFQATVDFTFKTAYMQGHLITGPAGQSLLEITTQSKFATGDPRQDYELTEDFQLSSAGASDFMLAPASPSLTIHRGGQASDVITIAPLNGSWDSAVQLSCAVDGPSPLPTCTLSQATVTPGAASATSILTVAASATTAMLAPSVNRHSSKSVYAAWSLLAVLGITLVVGYKDERRRYWMLCGFLVLLILLQAACGGGDKGVTQGSMQAPTNYTVTITGTSGTIQHTSQVTVAVQ